MKRCRYVHAGRVSAHYFDVLGVHLAAGRSFSEVEDRPHGPKTVILSYRLWQDEFGGDRGLLGQTIQLKSEPYTVIGVLPEGATTPLNADVYTALQPSREGEGSGTNFDAITRLRDGATWQEADAQINRAWADRSADFAEAEPRIEGKLSLCSAAKRAERRTAGKGSDADDGGRNHSADCLRQPGRADAGADFAAQAGDCDRLALGASHWQIQKQLWVENIILALGGGLAGVGVGFVALRGLLSLCRRAFCRWTACRWMGVYWRLRWRPRC